MDVLFTMSSQVKVPSYLVFCLNISPMEFIKLG